MSVRIDFYILPDAVDQGRLQLACKLAEKAFEHDHEVYLLAEDERQASLLDDLLWTFKQNSFIPHARHPAPEENPVPVLIGTDPAPDCTGGVLINLTAGIPAGFQRFDRVLELVDQDDAVLTASRKRFRGYREQGLEPVSHKL